MNKGLVIVILAMVCAAGTAQADTILSSKHNLSVSGPGTVIAAQETEVCVFCHTAHNASPAAPLWNRASPGQAYLPYSSSTAKASPGQPTGSSLLCLSCHDGTIALGQVLNRATEITMAGGVTFMPPGDGLIGTDLRNDHPISFAYTSALAALNGELVDPGVLRPQIRLDANGELQCTSCHDAHDDRYGHFLVWPNTRSQLCVECHRKNGWDLSPHNLSTAGWNQQAPDPWPRSEETTVMDNACGNCHLPHSAVGGPRLLTHAAEEQVCSACHNGHVASQDVMAEFSKFSSHPIFDTTLAHDPAEPAAVGDRHVECADCHEPHAATAGADPVQGVLKGARGIDLAGAEVDPIRNGYEVCFRCHADTASNLSNSAPRQHSQFNTRLEFQPGNPSFHPVAAAGRNPDVPSLISPLTTASTIACTDCHNSDASSVAGGTGPDGPHGSAFEPILARQYVTLDNNPESASAYALCYGCHSRSSILADQSFKKHNEHVVKKKAPCNVCHDPHGVSATQGTSQNNTHLINFDISVVQPNNKGLRRFVDKGRFTGSCDLLCHGENHDNKSY